jgi:L-iditol 2-dehydrogenase
LPTGETLPCGSVPTSVFASVEALSPRPGGAVPISSSRRPTAPTGFAHGTEAAAIGGRLVVVASPTATAYGFEAATARRKQLQVVFSRRMGDVLPRAIDIVARGRVDLEAWVSHRIGLAEVPDAFAKLAAYDDGAIKIVVEPH